MGSVYGVGKKPRCQRRMPANSETAFYRNIYELQQGALIIRKTYIYPNAVYFNIYNFVIAKQRHAPTTVISKP